MLDRKYLINNIDIIRQNLLRRGYILDQEYCLHLDAQRQKLTSEIRHIQEQQNDLAKKIASLKLTNQDPSHLIEKSSLLKVRLETLVASAAVVEKEWVAFYTQIPNIVLDSVTEHQVLIRSYGDPIEPTFHRSHLDAEDLNLAHGATVASARFSFLHKELASLHRAIAQFMIDTHIYEHDYQEVAVPYLVNARALYGSGQLPKMADALYQTNDGLYLIPTSEVSLVNLCYDTIMTTLPIKYVSYSPCFRREAGTYGRESRGLIRQHQFDKVELVNFTLPQDSEHYLELITQEAETILKKLNLAYRVVQLAADDTSFAASKTYDIEVWCPGQNNYVEISSASLCQDFQSRRIKARYRTINSMILPHTLNASGLAVGRTLVAIIENYQDETGYVHIPQVLQKYLNGRQKILVFHVDNTS